MGGQYPERVALGLSKDMHAALQEEARRNGRTLLAQIRYFCELGLQGKLRAASTDTELSEIKQRLQRVEEHLHAAESVPLYQREKGGGRKSRVG